MNNTLGTVPFLVDCSSFECLILTQCGVVYTCIDSPGATLR